MITDEDGVEAGQSKSEAKRECHHLADVAEEISKLSTEDRRTLKLPEDVEEAFAVVQTTTARGATKRQRRYIAKLLRSIDSEVIERDLKTVQHRHDTDTAQFKRLEKWRDGLVENDKEVFSEIIAQHPDVDRQHINRLIRVAQQETKQQKPPAAARKLFKYLRDLEESG